MQPLTKILVVDDEADIRNLLRLILEEGGFEVQMASNGKEGLEKVESESFDVIITDIRMPIMDGITFLKAAKTIYPAVVAIIITAYPNIETVKETYNKLVFDYIVKPFDPEVVVNCTNVALMRSRVAKELKKQVLKPRVLMVDDETNTTNLIESSFKDEGYYIEVADSVKDAIERFTAGEFDVVITDIRMPDMDGITLLDHVKTVKPETIGIVVTECPTVDLAIESMRHGAYDYVTKPLDLHGVIGIINDIDRAWENQSLRDTLTRVYRRSIFDEILVKECERVKRYKFPLSLILVDIDHFKSFNDAYGRLLGDAILQKVAVILSDSFRGSDTIARYGGNEFAILMPNTPKNDAIKMAERVKKSCVEYIKKNIDHKKLIVTISMGIGFLDEKTNLPVRGTQTDSVSSSNEILKQANTSLLSAKQSGGNRICCCEVVS